MPRLRIAPEAQRDIDGIFVYGIREFGLPQVDRYMQGLAELFRIIEANPMMNRERDEVRPPVRLAPYRAHHVFYDVSAAGDVNIVRVLHHTADWTTTL